MKKILLSLFMLLPIGVIASQNYAAKEVNAIFENLLKPYESQSTHLGIKFSELKVGLTNVNKVALEAWLFIHGTNNTLDLKISNLDYSYEANSKPTLVVEASLGMNLIKALGQDQVNELGESLNSLAVDFTKDLTNEYGQAVDAKAVVSNKTYDHQGNITALTLELDAMVDLKKLPVDVPVEKVEFTKGHLTVNFDTQGASVLLKVELNEEFRGFKREEKGLKEHLEAIANKDSRALNEISQNAGMIVNFATAIVEGKFSK